MNTSSVALALSCAGIMAAGSAHAIQEVDIQNITRNGVAATSPVFVGANDQLKFDAVLTANGSGGTTGLGLCLEFQMGPMGAPTFGNVFDNGKLAGQGTADPVANCLPQSSVPGSVQIPGSDTVVITSWANFSATGSFPGVGIPLKLYDAQFTLPAALSAPTTIGFAASSLDASQTFNTSGFLTACAKPGVTLNVIANGLEAGSVAATIAVVLSKPIPAICGGAGGFPVTMNLSGTATIPGQPNADYVIGGSQINASGAVVTATFPADGATTALTFSAKPVADTLTEGTESITLTVAAGSGNYDGVGTSATATIADAQTAAATVVEYLDTADFPTSPGGHFFYSSDPAEQAAVDAGAAGKFQRTGRTFKTGGTSGVCRFYGSITPGPNSHFFTVNPDECNALKAAMKTPTPTDVQQWNYERIEYNTTPPTVVNGVATCPAGTSPLYRAYNNAFTTAGVKNAWDSNHRFTPNRADIDAMVAVGWRDEGLQFCTAQ